MTATEFRGAGERVAAHLRAAILSGELGPGQWVRQEELAARLGASRIPVREALRTLESEGLVEHEAHRGSRVPLLDLHEVEVLYRMRERLEPLALAESLPHLTDVELTRMADVQARIEAGVDLAEFLTLDREFHLTSYLGCQVEQLLTTVGRLWNVTQHYRRAYMQLAGRDRQWVVDCEHRLLLDAVRRRDEVDADRYLAGHIRRTRVALSQHPELFPERDR